MEPNSLSSVHLHGHKKACPFNRTKINNQEPLQHFFDPSQTMFKLIHGFIDMPKTPCRVCLDLAGDCHASNAPESMRDKDKLQYEQHSKNIHQRVNRLPLALHDFHQRI